MTLGSKLRAIQAIYEEAGIAPGTQYTPDELIKKKEAIKYMLEGIRSKISVAIEAGDIPKIEVHDHHDMNWILEAEQCKGLFHKLWVEELQWYDSEGLDIKVSKAHDGGGVKEWLVVKVSPIDPNPTPGM